ncbi:ABC transporter ATP-binding protein [Ramlibacter solisilvae]|uniref:ABC transporter ATP-binding protein n=1 Tax=Ramlibacter tataouinensis TaxID=94132 RepID=A0A127JUF9_9BURK|nr:ABC transporter ATP-binding protein [Ramlibacter tataouinensis]AMO23534.1 ABC transporter ATP-binding protein [Ramlibacter tataouinensis]
MSLSPLADAGAPLQVQRLTVAYGLNAPVVRELSFELRVNEIACLLGPSGCGKTTVLRAVAGFVPLLDGRIVVGGREASSPTHAEPPERRGVGVVFQDYALFPHLSVADNIAFGLRRWDARERERRVGEMLQLVGLQGMARRYPHELSGGQQQRVALGRALAPQPALVLMDEPFSNLDVDLRERLSGEVREILKASGTSAVLVTHDQHEAFAMADVIGLMHEGRIDQWDAPYQLYHYPSSRFAADFVGAGVFVRGLVRDIAGERRISIALGDLDAGALAHGTPGQVVDVLLRPDDVLHDDAAPMTAAVVRKLFRGAEFLYTLRLDSGEEVLSLVPSHHNHAIGERIGVRLEVDQVVAFPVGAG